MAGYGGGGPPGYGSGGSGYGYGSSGSGGYGYPRSSGQAAYPAPAPGYPPAATPQSSSIYSSSFGPGEAASSSSPTTAPPAPASAYYYDPSRKQAAIDDALRKIKAGDSQAALRLGEKYHDKEQKLVPVIDKDPASPRYGLPKTEGPDPDGAPWRVPKQRHRTTEALKGRLDAAHDRIAAIEAGMTGSSGTNPGGLPGPSYRSMGITPTPVIRVASESMIDLVNDETRSASTTSGSSRGASPRTSFESARASGSSALYDMDSLSRSLPQPSYGPPSYTSTSSHSPLPLPPAASSSSYSSTSRYSSSYPSAGSSSSSSSTRRYR